MATPSITLHKGDLRTGWILGPLWRWIPVDGAGLGAGSLCVVQLSSGDGSAHLVQFAPDAYDAPNLKKMLGDPRVTRLFICPRRFGP